MSTPTKTPKKKAPSPKKTDAKRALVLPGGGAKGEYQRGVLNYLIGERNLQFDVIAGVSVGALNGVMLSMGRFDLLNRVWGTITEGDVFSRPSLWDYVKILAGRRMGLYSNDPLLSLLRRHDVRAEKTVVPFHFGAVNLESGAYVRMDNRHVSPESILASSAIPGVWPPTEFDGGQWVDGGVRNISPLGDVIEYDPEEIYIIPCSPQERPSKSEKEFSNIVDVASRSIDIMLGEVFRNDFEKFHMVNRLVKQAEGTPFTPLRDSGRPYRHYRAINFSPTMSMGESLDFSEESLKRRYEHGYRRGLEVMDLIEGDPPASEGVIEAAARLGVKKHPRTRPTEGLA